MAWRLRVLEGERLLGLAEVWRFGLLSWLACARRKVATEIGVAGPGLWALCAMFAGLQRHRLSWCFLTLTVSEVLVLRDGLVLVSERIVRFPVRCCRVIGAQILVLEPVAASVAFLWRSIGGPGQHFVGQLRHLGPRLLQGCLCWPAVLARPGARSLENGHFSDCGLLAALGLLRASPWPYFLFIGFHSLLDGLIAQVTMTQLVLVHVLNQFAKALLWLLFGALRVYLLHVEAEGASWCDLKARTGSFRDWRRSEGGEPVALRSIFSISFALFDGVDIELERLVIRSWVQEIWPPPH